MVQRVIIGLGIVIILAAAVFFVLQSRSSKATQQATGGELIYSATFDKAGQWEEGEYVSYRTNTDEVISRTNLAIKEGRYEMDYETVDPSFTLGISGEKFEPAANVIIEVDAEQLGGTDDNLYGVVCRLTLNESGRPTGGYALLISGDGHYGIAQLRPTNLEFVLDWHQSEVIRQGRAKNSIRAVCVDDYLAIYADGEFLGEIADVSNREAGQVALIVGTNRNHETHIAFDNLKVITGQLSQ